MNRLSEFTACSISDCVADALDSYSYETPDLAAAVHWQDGKDFKFYGSERLTKHIIWNLLTNALHYVKAEQKGEITIWLASDADYHYLYFKDTAKGMPAAMATQVFDQYFSKRRDGTGLGLSLCKMVMQAYGGDITCQAEDGEYAQFTLQFPHAKQQTQHRKSNRHAY